MTTILRQTLAVVLALTLLIASSTCTFAGCLLPSVAAKAGMPKMSCCATHHAPAHSRNRCPTCDHPPTSDAIQKAVQVAGPQLAPVFVAMDCDSLRGVRVILQSNRLSSDTAPPLPPTLVALHCALLI